jgi:hypothetical protein
MSILDIILNDFIVLVLSIRFVYLFLKLKKKKEEEEDEEDGSKKKMVIFQIIIV